MLPKALQHHSIAHAVSLLMQVIQGVQSSTFALVASLEASTLSGMQEGLTSSLQC